MKPKPSTGYFTPQASRRHRVSTPVHSEANDNKLSNMSDSFFHNLMSCPVRRELILNIISSEKENILKYKQKLAQDEKRKQCNGSPLSKVQKKYVCESPSALLRRRALEQQGRQSPQSELSDVSKSNSESATSKSASPIPFDKILDQVVAYVEIRSNDNKDRSHGAKALMQLMGAVIRDQFTRDVTHVVFKDGSFTTYEKAKLMKVHLVSVLWIEACRTTNSRVSENKFSAVGTASYDHNVSVLCSQMQKEYEDMIREEVRHSLVTRTPLPSTKSLIDRRRTMMTPFFSSSQIFSQEHQTSQDREVEGIISHSRKSHRIRNASPVAINLSPELTSDDDSDLGPCINGDIIRRRERIVLPSPIEDHIILNSLENLPESSNMELTRIENSESRINIGTTRKKTTEISKGNMETNNIDEPSNLGEITSDITDNMNSLFDSLYNKRTPRMYSKISSLKSGRSDDGTCSVPDDNVYRRRTRQLKINISRILTNSINKDKGGDSASSDIVRRTNGLKILSQNACAVSTKTLETHGDHCSSMSMSILQLSNEKQNVEKSNSTNMSSLHIYSGSGKDTCFQGNKDKVAEKSTSTNMSSLVISSDASKIRSNENAQESNNCTDEDSKKKRSSARHASCSKTFDSGDGSFSPLNRSMMNDVLQVIDQTPISDENVTRRRRGRRVGATQNTVIPLDEQNNKEEIIADDKRRSLRQRPQTAQKCLETKRKITLEKERRKTVLPLHIPEEGSNSDIPESTTPPKKLKTNGHSKKYMKHSHNASGLSDNKKLDSKTASNNDKQIDKTPSDDSETSGSGKKKRLRKLYNPDESFKKVSSSDDQERKLKRKEVKKRNSNEGAILNPNVVTVNSQVFLTAKAKEFLERNKMDLNKILDEVSQETQAGESSVPQKRGRGKKKEDDKSQNVNSDDDEQKTLAAELMKEREEGEKLMNTKTNNMKSEGKIINKRRSVRLSQHPRKKLNFNSASNNNQKPEISKNPTVRRSTMEFQSLSQMSAKKKLKIDRSKQPRIVCTRLHKDDIQVFYQIVKKLGGFVIEDEVSDKTTHLVAGEPKRTVNMLRAIARGCWIVKHEWLLKSLEEGKWLPEEDFEETDFSPSVQKCRIQRQAFGASFSMDIFQDCGPIYIAKGSNPRCSDLRELVDLCKGKVVTIPRNASIVVGEYVRYDGVKCVKETWLLDSITYNKRMPYKKYIIASGADSPHV